VITADFKRLGLSPGARVLDLGCGSGRHTCEAFRYPQVTAVGADRNPADLAEARNRLRFHEAVGAHGGGRWALLAADARQLPFPAAAFDVVICSEVLEHIPEHRAAAAEIVRVLRPGGLLAVSVPRYLPERVCWALSAEYHNTSQGHVRIYRRREVLDLFTPHGLIPRGGHHAHALHTPFWWLKCLVGPQRDQIPAVRLYHRLLVWDILRKPLLTRLLERLLNPLLGKSLVLYFQKPAAGS
jgi:ubiquinone/menaquinone biosynthesis C-methylase UbiE